MACWSDGSRTVRGAGDDVGGGRRDAGFCMAPAITDRRLLHLSPGLIQHEHPVKNQYVVGLFLIVFPALQSVFHLESAKMRLESPDDSGVERLGCCTLQMLRNTSSSDRLTP